MSNRIPMWWIVLTMVVISSTLLALAAPVLPRKWSAPDPVVSVAGLSTVQLEVVEVPADLRDLGVSREDLRVRCRRTLRTAEFDLDAEGAHPVLKVKLYWMSATELPDAAGYVVSLRLSQPARVDRVDKLLNIPTFALVAGNIETKENLNTSLDRAVDQLLRNFINATRRGAEAIDEHERDGATSSAGRDRKQALTATRPTPRFRDASAPWHWRHRPPTDPYSSCTPSRA